MHPAIQKIFTDAGATPEDFVLLDTLGGIVRQEARDAVKAASETLRPDLQEAAAVYFARAVEAAMLDDYKHWKTDDAPEA